MKVLLVSFLVVSGLAQASDDWLPYNLKEAQAKGCNTEDRYASRIPAKDKVLCPSAIAKIAYELRFSYGVGERPWEDGCDPTNLRMSFTFNADNSITLLRTDKKNLRAHLYCGLEGEARDLIFIDYDPRTEKILSVAHEGLPPAAK